jgi:hypothetical protein
LSLKRSINSAHLIEDYIKLKLIKLNSMGKKNRNTADDGFAEAMDAKE